MPAPFAEYPTPIEEATDEKVDITTGMLEEVVKRGRGRPRKILTPEEIASAMTKVKRGPSRPRTRDPAELARPKRKYVRQVLIIGPKPEEHPAITGYAERGENADNKANFSPPDMPIDLFLERIAVRVVNLREKAGMNKVQLASACGINYGVYKRLERGHEPLTLPKLRRIAAALGVSMASLLDTEAELPETSPVVRETWSITEPGEKNLLRIFRQLMRKEKRILFGMIRVIVAARHNRKGPKDPILKGIR